MDLSLNADAALRHYLPPESWNGDAQHRFVFRAENGDEEPLLARLALVEQNSKNQEYCVVLRPECAEPSRIFIVQSKWYDKSVNLLMTPQELQGFNWALFEHRFNHNRWRRGLSRFWKGRKAESDIALQIGVDGCGHVLESENKEKRSMLGVGFIWREDRFTSDDQQDLLFLRQNTRNFRRQIRGRLNKGGSEIQFALHWQLIQVTDYDAHAFHCENGTWNELKSVAAMVLHVGLARLKRLPQGTLHWDFAQYGPIAFEGSQLFAPDFLAQWRTAIVQVFSPSNIDAGGVMADVRPLCVWKHIMGSDLRFVSVETPSQHELLESQLKLREWVLTNFPPEEASRLLAF